MQILNMSVYGGSCEYLFNHHHKSSIGELNVIDSLVEYVAEVVLDNNNAIPENGAHNDNSTHSSNIKHVDIKQVVHVLPTSHFSTYEQSVAYLTPLNVAYTSLFPKEITPPPPKC